MQLLEFDAIDGGVSGLQFDELAEFANENFARVYQIQPKD